MVNHCEKHAPNALTSSTTIHDIVYPIVSNESPYDERKTANSAQHQVENAPDERAENCLAAMLSVCVCVVFFSVVFHEQFASAIDWLVVPTNIWSTVPGDLMWLHWAGECLFFVATSARRNSAACVRHDVYFLSFLPFHATFVVFN